MSRARLTAQVSRFFVELKIPPRRRWRQFSPRPKLFARASLVKRKDERFRLMLPFPPWLDASKNFSGLLYVTIGPKPNLYPSDPLQSRRVDCSGCNVAVYGHKRDV